MESKTDHLHRNYRYHSQFLGGDQSNAAEPVFFVSGAFQTMESWRRFADHFRKQRPVILADLPGSGSADVLPASEDLELLADCVREVLDHYRVPRATLISASYGTPVAYQFAQKFGDRVSGIVLAGTMKAFPDHQRDAARESLDMLRNNQMEPFAQRVIDSLLCQNPSNRIEKGTLAKRVLYAQLKKMPPPFRKKYYENTERLLRHAPLDLSRPPATRSMVFTGEHDIFTTPNYCREIAASLPDSHFTTIRNADHLFHIERFETTLEILDRFVNRLPLEAIPECHPVERFQNRRTAGLQADLVAASV